MILNEGVRVRILGDNQSLVQSLKGGSLAAAAFKGSIVASMTAVAAQSARMSMQLDKDLRLVATLGGEAAGNTERLRKEVQKLGVEFGRSFNELAQANYQAVSGGFKSISASMELTRAGTKLAVAGNADLVGSTEAVVKALNAFKLEAKDADAAAAQLWGITRDGIITVEQLSRFLADLPVTAAASGLKFEEMSAAISTLTAAGVPASTAMDQLRSAIIGFERLGLTGSLVDRTRKFVGQGLEQIRMQVGDQTAARGILVLASSLGRFESNVEAAKNVTDDYNTAVETMAGSALTQWERGQQNLNRLMQDFGAAMREIVTPAVIAFNAALEETPESKLIGINTFSNGPQPGGKKAESILDAAARTPGLLTGGTWAGGATSAPIPVAIVDAEPGVLVSGGFNDAGIVLGTERFNFGPPPFQNPNIPGQYAPPQSDPTRDFIAGELGEFDWAELERGLAESHKQARKLSGSINEVSMASQFGSIAVYSLAGALSTSLVNAFGESESAVARFVKTLLAEMAKMAIIKIATSIVTGGTSAAAPVPAFARGGFTGGSGGMVHANEYVFNSSAVNALGLGRLERMHAVAQAGATYNTTVNVSAPSGDASVIASMTADQLGMKLRELDTTNRRSLYRPAAAKYGG